MKIEAGKYYRTRDGRKVGPMKSSGLEKWPWRCTKIRRTFTNEGRQGYDIGQDSEADLVAEWTDTPTQDTPALWRDMTPEEKGALLLAHHEGGAIEVYAIYDDVGPDWELIKYPSFIPKRAYRVKPAPVVETVTMTGADFGKGASVAWSFRQNGHIGRETHRIILKIRDGVVDPVAQVEPLS